MKISENDKDYRDLNTAVNLLESTSITAQISNLIGSPIESAVKVLPDKVAKGVNGLVEGALNTAVDVAFWTLENKPNTEASPRLNKLFAAASGGLGGAFGFAALSVELPISTTILMRSVADIARSEGFDLADFPTKAACIEVFALGGPSKKDDASDTGYYIARGFMTGTMNQASKTLLEMAAKSGAESMHRIAPAQAGKLLAEVIQKVAARFGLVISQKVAAQVIPAIGAISGATLNLMFTDFYQDMARGHFIVKRLERKYSAEVVKAEYEFIAGRAVS